MNIHIHLEILKDLSFLKKEKKKKEKSVISLSLKTSYEKYFQVKYLVHNVFFFCIKSLSKQVKKVW